MKKIAVLIFICIGFNLKAQISKKFISAEINLGTVTYVGDLSNGIKSTKPSLSMGIDYHLNNRISVKGTLFQGWINDNDKNSNDELRKLRNLSVKTHLSELSLQFVYRILATSRRPKYRPKFIPFLSFGIGVLNFNPKTDYFGKTYSLQKLGTEGQFLPNSIIKPYSTNVFVLPIDIGFEIKVNTKMSISVKGGLRLPNTDYLDDVSSNVPDLELLNAQNSLAAAFANRTNENLSNGIPFSNNQVHSSDYRVFNSNKPRGDNLKRDIYYTVSFGFFYILENNNRKE